MVNDPCLTFWRLCSHPHAHHTLACRSSRQDEPSRCWRWPDTHTRASFSSFARLHPLLARFSLILLSFTLFYYLQNVSLSPFPLLLHSERPSFTVSSLERLSPRISSQNVFLYLLGVSTGCRPPQAHPTPLGHGYHDNPCALKKGGRRCSRKIAAEEI